MFKDRQNFIIQLLALTGLGLAIKLAFIYYTANYDEYALSSFCSISDFIDCDGVAKSKFAHFLGIPLAYWGIFFYLTTLFLTVVDRLKNIKCLFFLNVFKAPKAYITALGVISFICSMILAYISLKEIGKICILCFITYLIDLAIALVAGNGRFKNIVSAFKTTFFDFIEGVKKYTAAFIVLSILFSGFLAYSEITYNFVPKFKRIRNIQKYNKIKYNPYRAKGNTLGNPNGNVVIELYSDYVCPLCYINNIMLHQAVKEYKNIHVIHHNYPFDKTCNYYLQIDMHPNACYMSRAALASQKQGAYWEMSSLLYENHPTKQEDLIKIVEQTGMDKDKFLRDFNSEEIKQELLSEINEGAALEIDATPTMYINGEKYVGVKPYYELTRILVEHGAEK